jgi:uncharacterized MAPEG superfamily protein
VVEQRETNETKKGNTMIDVILLTLLLALIQLWLLPMMLNISNLPYLLSSRDEPIDESVLLGRAKRAGANLQESLPAFLVLAVLGYVNQVDMVLVASIWLALRAAYVPLYVFNVTHIRSLVWMVSLGCLICMAVMLVGAA